MARKENKGGLLSNEQVEKDNEVKGKAANAGQYIGTQDTGDSIVRELGSEVQQNDGITEGGEAASENNDR